MNRQITLKAALLPFYLELYDKYFSGIRPRLENFLDRVAGRLESADMTIIKLPVCRTRSEFEEAVKKAESEKAVAIITLHLAYSPSLEAVDPLVRTPLPVIIMDTTPAYAFGPDQSSDEIMYNHGIHGVQDLCNLLIRHKKYFSLETGHIDHSDIIPRIRRHVQAAGMVFALRHGRTGRIGRAFPGMGDFLVQDEDYSSLGISVLQTGPEAIAAHLPDENDPRIREELEKDAVRFDMNHIDMHVYRRSVRYGLALRDWVEQEKLSAFTLNFMEVDKKKGLAVMPFLEISKLLAKGIGYAGEGDLLTSSLTGALFSLFREVTFTEMFCPDWKNGIVFLSHMGEMNIHLSAFKPRLITLPWRFSEAYDPVIAAGSFKEGEALVVNLAPVNKNVFRLIVAPVDVLPEGKHSRFSKQVRGWMKPAVSLPEFLKKYSLSGGTHHIALVYTNDREKEMEVISEFGKMMKWEILFLG